MASQPNETPQEDIRNAAAVLQGCGVWSHDMEDNAFVTFTKADYAAIMDRLSVAVLKLETPRN